MGPLARLSSSHSVDEAWRLAGGSRATDRSRGRQRRQSEVRVRRLGSIPAPASWRIHRCGGQEAQEGSGRHILTVSTLRPRARQGLRTPRRVEPRGSLDAEIIIANAPDPVFVSDLEGKILQANAAVSELLGLRPHEPLEQSLSRCISPREKREFMAALRAVVEQGVMRNAVLHPRSASGKVIPTVLNASALRDPAGKVIGAIGIPRDMRAYAKVRRDLEESKSELQEKIRDLEKLEEVVVERELRMIALEKKAESLRREAGQLKLELSRT